MHVCESGGAGKLLVSDNLTLKLSGMHKRPQNDISTSGALGSDALKCHAGRGGFAVGADVATNTTINRGMILHLV